jgi:hypothetical protein
LALFAVNANHTSTALAGTVQYTAIPAVEVAFQTVAAVFEQVVPVVINWGFEHGSYQGAWAKARKGDNINIIRNIRRNNKPLKKSILFIQVNKCFFIRVGY